MLAQYLYMTQILGNIKVQYSVWTYIFIVHNTLENI